MDNGNNNQIDARNNDFFSRSITAAFVVASSLGQDELRYTPPDFSYRKNMPEELRQQNRNPWREGWHNGFPPPSGV